MREIAILTFVSLDGFMESPMVPDEDLPGRFTEGGLRVTKAVDGYIPDFDHIT